jgi:hypothetical protein
MKKIIISIICILGMAFHGISQDAVKIGTLKNGNLQITNMDFLKAMLYYEIGKTGVISKDYKVNVSPQKDRIVVSFPVSNNKKNINNVSVMLVNNSSGAYVRETDSAGSGVGGSITVTCVGNNECTLCRPTVNWVTGQWLPQIACECLLGYGSCTMTSSLTVSLGVYY